MPAAPLSDELAREAVEAVARFGDKAKAARGLGVAPGTFDKRHAIGIRRGFGGTAPVMPGFEITRVTNTPNGDYIQQKPERGEEFAVPDGHVVKGISALVDADGRTIQQWVKTREDGAHVVLDAIKAAFEAYKPAKLVKAPAHTTADLLTVYPIADLHLGMFSWAKETGADYDINIASDLLRQSMQNLVSRSAAAEHAVVLDLGDYFHSDNSLNRTMRSGNPLDVDTRYSKVVQMGFELIIEGVELALQKHEFVEYRKLPGNHDDESSRMLAIAVAAHFRSNPRVKVETDPSRFFMREHGRCLVTATHGDMLKMGDMAGFVAAQWPQEWGRTTYRYGYTGHVHNERSLAVNTQRGLRAESFNTLAAKDAWHAGEGYQSPRNMVSITLHKDRGEVDRFTVAV